MARFRKILTEKEAGDWIESSMQSLSTNLECIYLWRMSKPSRADSLIASLCDKTKDEMIADADKQNAYLQAKIDYAKQFCPDYKIKGSFGWI